MHELEKKNKSWYNNWHKEMIFCHVYFFPIYTCKNTCTKIPRVLTFNKET